VKTLLCQLTLLYEAAIWVRVILSWFPTSPGTMFGRANNGLVRVTEPVLGPIRRLLPRTGMFDLSPIIAALGIEIVVRQIILGCYR
jgi:YggT family protein